MAKQQSFSNEQRVRAEEFVRDCYRTMNGREPTDEIVKTVSMKVLKTLPSNSR